MSKQQQSKVGYSDTVVKVLSSLVSFHFNEANFSYRGQFPSDMGCLNRCIALKQDVTSFLKGKIQLA